MKFKKYLLERLKEPSTWRGAVMLITALGVNMTPEQSDAIVALGMALAGMVGMFAPDGGKA